MNRIKRLISVLMAGFMVLGITLVLAEEIGEDMSHAEFARMLVKAIEAEGYLPTAAVDNDYFVFLTELGVVPTEGWNPEGVITFDDLKAMLNLGAEEAAGLSFTNLIERLEGKLIRLIKNKARVKRSVSPEVL